MHNSCDLKFRIELQTNEFLSKLNYPEFITKYQEHQDTIQEHLQKLPPNFISTPVIFQAALISATVQATQERRTGGWTFQKHVLKVAKTAYDEAQVMKQNGEAIDPNTCAILALLHDTIEDAGKNDLNPDDVQDLILNLFGEELYQQVKHLTMQLKKEPTDKSKRDNLRTEEWLERIPQIAGETQLVKLADIYWNLDGEPLRKSLWKQRKQILETLTIITPLKESVNEKLNKIKINNFNIFI